MPRKSHQDPNPNQVVPVDPEQTENQPPPVEPVEPSLVDPSKQSSGTQDSPADVPAEEEVHEEDAQLLIPTPTVGRTVHFYLSNDQVRPAIIVGVHYAEVVDLQVFTNGQADRQLIPERMVMVNVRTGADQHVVPPVVHRAGVLMGPVVGRWMWPVKM